MINIIKKAYIQLIPIMIIITLIIIYKETCSRDNLTLLFSVLGGILSSIYLIQKHDLEYIQSFKDLFNMLNKRYDFMNEKLNKIVLKKSHLKLTQDEINTINDYLNLCSEEYLYYKKGFIYREVWKTWCNGIRYFIDNDRIRKYCDKEFSLNSYYGLTRQIIYRYSSI
jgi:hypothetical protein